MPEWSKGAACKAVIRGFKSRSALHEQLVKSLTTAGDRAWHQVARNDTLVYRHLMQFSDSVLRHLVRFMRRLASTATEVTLRSMAATDVMSGGRRVARSRLLRSLGWLRPLVGAGLVTTSSSWIRAKGSGSTTRMRESGSNVGRRICFCRQQRSRLSVTTLWLLTMR